MVWWVLFKYSSFDHFPRLYVNVSHAELNLSERMASCLFTVLRGNSLHVPLRNLSLDITTSDL